MRVCGTRCRFASVALARSILGSVVTSRLCHRLCLRVWRWWGSVVADGGRTKAERNAVDAVIARHRRRSRTHRLLPLLVMPEHVCVCVFVCTRRKFSPPPSSFLCAILCARVHAAVALSFSINCSLNRTTLTFTTRFNASLLGPSD